mgnify:CR=1 FL=1
MIDNSDDLSNHFNHYNDDQRKCLKFAVISDPHLVSPNFQNDTRLAEESVEIFRETIKQIQFTNTDFKNEKIIKISSHGLMKMY